MVVALGGHAIVPHGEAGTAEQQVATIAAEVLHGRSGTRVTRSAATVGAGR